MSDLSKADDVAVEIEQILSGSPSRIAFRALCAAIGRADNPKDLVRQCDQRLAAWPAEVREAPWSWLAALDAGYTTPVWQLVRSLVPTAAQPIGTLDLVIPDPRSHPEIRGVTHLDLGHDAHRRLAPFIESLDSWDGLRAIRIGGLWSDSDGEDLAVLAGSGVVARLESLDLDASPHLMFRPPTGPSWQLRHAGLRAGDLIHVMSAGLVPNLRSVDVFVGSIEDARNLAECAELARIDRLTIKFGCGRNGTFPRAEPYLGNVIAQDDNACEVFFARAKLPNLRSLEIAGTATGREGLGARAANAIAASGVLRQLTELEVSALPFGDAAVARMVAGVDPGRIEKMTLTDLFATDLTATAFVEVGTFPCLRHLDLSCNRLGEEGAKQLAANVAMPALEHLDLSGERGGSPYYSGPEVQPIGNAGAIAWAKSANAATLRHLDLSATGLGPDGLIALMQSDRLQQLATVYLADNPIHIWPAGLGNSPRWRTLHTLDLTECGLDSYDINKLVSTPIAPHLRSISLAYNSIGSLGARALAAWPLLPQLWELDLHDNIIDDTGLIALAASRSAQRLLELDLELDCWSSRAREYDYETQVPAEVLDRAAFPSLDSIRLGLIDEYHGARYTGGLPIHLLSDMASAPDAWPVLMAFLTHLETAGLWTRAEPEPESEGLDFSGDVLSLDNKRNDRDFRSRRFRTHDELLARARDHAQRMIDGDTVAAPGPATS